MTGTLSVRPTITYGTTAIGAGNPFLQKNQQQQQQKAQDFENDRAEMERGLLQSTMSRPASRVKNSLFEEGSIAGIISGMAKQ